VISAAIATVPLRARSRIRSEWLRVFAPAALSVRLGGASGPSVGVGEVEQERLGAGPAHDLKAKREPVALAAIYLTEGPAPAGPSVM
jgi:hypothetical protein